MNEDAQELRNEVSRLEQELAAKENLIQSEKHRLISFYSEQIGTFEKKEDNLRREVQVLRSELEKREQELQASSTLLQKTRTTMIEVEAQLKAEKTWSETLQQKIHVMETKINKQSQILQEQELKIHTGETQRRKLHNEVQELKGNIRVFCRLRPLLKNESETTNIKIQDQQIELLEMRESAEGKTLQKSYPFTFDKVFDQFNTQEQVFEEISQLVQSALDGYNICIFAYGQTGSGKTYTMEGKFDVEMGMIPRTVNQIFSSALQLEEKGWNFEIEGQYLEIYNEQIRDLLGPEKKHEIRHLSGKTMVLDMTLVKLTSSSEAMGMLRKAAKNRTTQATLCNERSSRSHSVFTIIISGKNKVTMEQIEGRVNLVDLAGSERLNSSGATGDRLKETQNINRSLSSLGDVIQALSNKDQHVPYRNSKLTYLLQNSLGGNSKTLMFVNISPLQSSQNESLNSLRFAAKVNSCQIGTARRQKQ